MDAMLETAFAGVVEEADAFVQLTVSERKGSLFLDVDYVTGKRVPHKKEQALADALENLLKQGKAPWKKW